MNFHPSMILTVSMALFACTPDGGGGDEVGNTETAGTDSTSGDSTSTDSTSGDSTSEGTSTDSSSGDSTDSTDSTSSDSTDSTSETGDPDPIVSTFSCEETSVVEPFLQLTITGGFTAQSEPRNLVATHTLGGAIEFSVPIPALVDPNDANYADVVYWEMQLSMVGYDVNLPDDGTDDSRYLFLPSGAEGVSTFDAFYYRVYGVGGTGQFDFTCTAD
ncbi:hypothetical protein ACNOYE_06550 [Nannocystaceae bacterium ST9]